MSNNSKTFSPSNSQDSAASESIYRSPQMRKEALRTVYENAQALRMYYFIIVSPNNFMKIIKNKIIEINF